ncbi:hypothetical protein ACJX0J_019883, partial [Zea mays]
MITVFARYVTIFITIIINSILYPVYLKTKKKRGISKRKGQRKRRDHYAICLILTHPHEKHDKEINYIGENKILSNIKKLHLFLFGLITVGHVTNQITYRTSEWSGGGSTST